MCSLDKYFKEFNANLALLNYKKDIKNENDFLSSIFEYDDSNCSDELLCTISHDILIACNHVELKDLNNLVNKKYGVSIIRGNAFCAY